MKKKLLALVLSVVMLAAVLVPVLAASAEGPTLKISLGTPTLTERNDVKVIAIPVLMSENTGELFALRYQVLASEGVETYYDEALYDEGFDLGDVSQKYGTKTCELANTGNPYFEEGGKKGFKVVQDAINGPAGRGITSASGTLLTVYFKAPTAVGTYEFEVVWMDGTDNNKVNYNATVGAKVTYEVACTTHTPGEPEVVTPAKCGVAGEAVIKCTACKKVLDTKTLPALEHDWDEGVTAENVPCGSTADVTKTCKREGCGETKVETGAVVEHDWVEDTAAYEAPKCEVEGAKHFNCSNPNCPVKTKTEKVDALQHDWDEGVTAENVPCGSTADVTKTCQREGCGETKVETGAVVEHIMVEDKEAYEAPKCGVAGKKVYKCTRGDCDHTEEEAVAALEHIIVEDKDAYEAPKCGVEGKKVYVCSQEGCDHTYDEEVAALEHDIVEDKEAYEAPKCGVEGKKVYVCDREGCDHTYDEEVAALEHNIVEDKDAYEAPKCGVEGKKVYVCDREGCDHTYDEAVAALEHDFSGEKVIVKKATANEKGLYTIACVNDGCEEVEEHDIELSSGVANKEDGLYFESDKDILPEDITIVGDANADEENNKVEITFTFSSESAVLEGEVTFGMDTKELAGLKNFKIYTVNAAGERVEVETEIKDGILTFTADLEAEYILEADIVKTSPETSDAANVAVFAVVALMAVAALVVVGKKRFAL